MRLITNGTRRESAVRCWRTGLPIMVDVATEARAWSDTISLARQHALTAYDATSLEIAIREELPIATLDAPLKVAARALGVPVYQP